MEPLPRSLRRAVAGGEWSAPTPLSWVAGDGPVAPHTEVADHERVYDGNRRLVVRSLDPRGQIREDELLDERTLPFEPEALERALRRWPQVRCCYEAGPTGFGVYRHLVERGIDCQVVAPGLVPTRRVIASRPTPEARVAAAGAPSVVGIDIPDGHRANRSSRMRARSLSGRVRRRPTLDAPNRIRFVLGSRSRRTGGAERQPRRLARQVLTRSRRVLRAFRRGLQGSAAPRPAPRRRQPARRWHRAPPRSRR